jgi:hypothetical protein
MNKSPLLICSNHFVRSISIKPVKSPGPFLCAPCARKLRDRLRLNTHKYNMTPSGVSNRRRQEKRQRADREKGAATSVTTPSSIHSSEESSLYSDDLLHIVSTAVLADSVRHHKLTAFRALDKIRNGHFPVRSSFIASCLRRFIFWTDGHFSHLLLLYIDDRAIRYISVILG